MKKQLILIVSLAFIAGLIGSTVTQVEAAGYGSCGYGGNTNSPCYQYITPGGVSYGSNDDSVTITGEAQGSDSSYAQTPCYENPQDSGGEYEDLWNMYTATSEPLDTGLTTVGGVGEVGNATLVLSQQGSDGTCDSNGNVNDATDYQYVYSYTLDTSAYPNGTYTSTVYLTDYYPGCAPVQSNPQWHASCDGSIAVQQFTINHQNSQTSSSINVSADRSANWKISGAATNTTYNGSGTTGSYTNTPADTYTLTDPATGNSPYGFTDNPTFTLRKDPSVLARIVKSAEASNCAGWICTLTSGGTVNYNLTSTECSITVQTAINGNVVPISLGVSYNVSGPVDASSTYSSTPQTFNLVADASGSQFTLNNIPQTITYSEHIADLVGISPGNPSSCSAGGNITISANYTTRGNINIK